MRGTMRWCSSWNAVNGNSMAQPMQHCSIGSRSAPRKYTASDNMIRMQCIKSEALQNAAVHAQLQGMALHPNAHC